ncbi:sulfite exporter TauE/SafE family protein [Bordetella sp. 15P40C-2]|uniref:sulfite exporter TauE/SafE family protein n=1 Tax=Bordetella sp. 15P40C-2 TaxID=2572246 RepID=UPI00132C1491|nr:sulfite exporter TauE/SafE family protein [Bordetella sp. 15P40C-2]MVW70291.1 TSUP family transporter [Bordetella sp. 15P40C-2]
MQSVSQLTHELSWNVYLGMGFMVAAGAWLQGIGGLGYAMFCAPIAALLFPQLVPGPLLAVGAPLALLAYLRERPAMDWRIAGATLAGRVAGTVLAAGCLAYFSTRTMSLMFALMILTGVALSLIGWRARPSMSNLAVAGVASGLMGTITSAGGPPYAVAMQSLRPATIRATLGIVFFIGTIVSLVALSWAGRMSSLQWWISLALLPWMGAGFWLSTPMAKRFSQQRIRRYLLAIASLGAAGVLIQVLLND